MDFHQMFNVKHIFNPFLQLPSIFSPIYFVNQRQNQQKKEIVFTSTGLFTTYSLLTTYYQQMYMGSGIFAKYRFNVLTHFKMNM